MCRELAAHPDWQRGTRTRLIAAVAIAAAGLGAFIFKVNFTKDEAPLKELVVTLLTPRAPQPPPSPPAEEELEPLRVEEAVRELPALSEFVEPAEAPEPDTRDWYAAMAEVVADVVTGEHRTDSVNPVFDAQRRTAAEQFRPSRAPVAKPIWENVERDQLGRRVLVHGNCERVVDDPNVGSNEIFRTFGQYIVSCSNDQRQPQELPWVDEIRDRRVYLQPDPDIREDRRRELMAYLP